MSPQNRPLTYSYSATAGTVSGSGTTRYLLLHGRADRRGRHHLQRLRRQGPDGDGQHQRDHHWLRMWLRFRTPRRFARSRFDKDKKRPTRVDNEAKACLDEVALDLQKQSDAKAVVVGSRTPRRRTPRRRKRSAP